MVKSKAVWVCVSVHICFSTDIKLIYGGAGKTKEGIVKEH